jgi:hypothetical protein
MRTILKKPFIILIAVPIFIACFLAAMFLHGLQTQNFDEQVQAAIDEAALRVTAHVDGLPNVLVIGDSISIGYLRELRARLAGLANVEHPPENCRSSQYVLSRVDTWLADRHYDVIVFNAGLHDLKHVEREAEDDLSNGMVDVAAGPRLIPLEAYARNLEVIADKLRRAATTVIFATTTPVPSGAFGRSSADVLLYNREASRIMSEKNIAVIDLYGVGQAHVSLQFPKNVHYTVEGSKVLAAAVAEEVARHLRSSH